MNLAPCLSGASSQQLDPTQAPAHPAVLRPPSPNGNWENPPRFPPVGSNGLPCLLPSLPACLLPSAGCRCPSAAELGEVTQKALVSVVGYDTHPPHGREITPLHPTPAMCFDEVPAVPAQELPPGWVTSEGMYPRAMHSPNGYQTACWCTHGCSAAEPCVPRQSRHCAMGMVALSHPSKEFKYVDDAS